MADTPERTEDGKLMHLEDSPTPIEEIIGWTHEPTTIRGGVGQRDRLTLRWYDHDDVDHMRAEVDDLILWIDANIENALGHRYWDYGGRPGNHFVWLGVGMKYIGSTETGRHVHNTLLEALDALIRKIVES